MTPNQFVSRLKDRGITLRAVGDRIQARPATKLGPEDRDHLQQLKPELLRLLNGDRQTDGSLDRDERDRLIGEMLDRLNRVYRGQPIDWRVLDQINAKVAETISHRDLTNLLKQYEANFIDQTCDQLPRIAPSYEVR
jgi:hypothetical protein